MRESPIVFSSGTQRDLVGVLTMPEQVRGHADRPDIGFVFVCSGARGRLGNTFHYPYMARKFAKAGYPSLRFDPPGLGDGSGEIPSGPMSDLYHSITNGCFVDSTLAAIAEVRTRIRPKKLVVLGICGGAITALETGARDPKIDALVLLSTPVARVGGGVSEAERIPYDAAVDNLVMRYKRKLLSPKAWMRLLTLKSDWSTIKKYTAAAVFGSGSVFARARAKIRSLSTKDPTSDPMYVPPTSIVNPLFVSSLATVVGAGRKALFLYGTVDEANRHFEKEFRPNYWARNPNFERHCSIHRIPNCNHMFTLREWQDEAVAVSSRWLSTLWG